jgi:predicted ATPase
VEIKRELEPTRLLTLGGAGDSRKTCMALGVARDLLDSYPDGVWLVELAPLSERKLVPRAMAAGTLGVLECPQGQLADALASVRAGQLIRLRNFCQGDRTCTTP